MTALSFILGSLLWEYLCFRYESKEPFDPGMTLIACITAIGSQGNYRDTQKCSTRIILLTMMTASLVLNTVYSANLTSVLFAKKVSKPFDSLHSLYHKTDFTIRTISSTSYAAKFKVLFFISYKYYMPLLTTNQFHCTIRPIRLLFIISFVILYTV